MLLFIDTSDLHQMTFALIPNNGNIVRQEFTIAYNESDQTLGILDRFLKQNKLSSNDISKIIACSGPGSFTGTRVGITIAQAFGFAKKIPVYAIPKSKIPADLQKLKNYSAGKKLTIEYNRPPF